MEKVHFFQRQKFFLHIWKNQSPSSLIWFNPKNKFLLKDFLYLPEKKQTFKPKNCSHPSRNIDSAPKEKKNYNYRKKQFSEQKNFLYLREKLKTLHFRWVLNMTILFLCLLNWFPIPFFCLQNVNMVFNKLVIVLVCLEINIKKHL